MKKLNILLLALALTAATGATAQRRNRGNEADMANQRKEMVQRQASQLVERMALDDTTAAWFMPLYAEYSEALFALRKEAMPNKDKKIDELSDLDAEQLIRDALDSEEKQVAVKREYLKRFQERLTPQQLVKVFTMQRGQGGQHGQGGQGGREGYGPGRGFPGGGFPPGGFPGGHGGFDGPGF